MDIKELEEAVETIRALSIEKDKFRECDLKAFGILCSLAESVLAVNGALREFIWERCEADDRKTDEIIFAIAGKVPSVEEISSTIIKKMYVDKSGFSGENQIAGVTPCAEAIHALLLERLAGK